MTKEWFHNIPKNGILCKCKYDKGNDHYNIDIITRYNDHPLSDYKFRSIDKFYADAIPMTVTEVNKLLYIEVNDE